MTTLSKDEIIAWAREARLHVPFWYDDQDINKDEPMWTMVSPIVPLLNDFATLCRADLVAELAALRGSGEAVCFMCHGKGEHLMATAHLPGQPEPKPMIVKCTQCKKYPQPSAVPVVRELVEALSYAWGCIEDITDDEEAKMLPAIEAGQAWLKENSS